MARCVGRGPKEWLRSSLTGLCASTARQIWPYLAAGVHRPSPPTSHVVHLTKAKINRVAVDPVHVTSVVGGNLSPPWKRQGLITWLGAERSAHSVRLRWFWPSSRWTTHFGYAVSASSSSMNTGTALKRSVIQCLTRVTSRFDGTRRPGGGPYCFLCISHTTTHTTPLASQHGFFGQPAGAHR